MFRIANMSNRTSIKYSGATINTSKTHINNLYIKYTLVHFAILLIHQIFGVVPLPVTISFAVEALSFRLRSRLGFLLLSSNWLVVLLEVPLLPFFLKLVILSTINTLMFFFDFYLRQFQHHEELRNRFRHPLHYSSSRSSTNLVMVTREFYQSLSYLED